MVSELFKKCSLFARLAELSVSRVSTVENTNPLLKELSELKDFEDRVAFAKKKFKTLGEGSSRTIFQMKNGLVLKIAHNDKGIVQNLAEMKPAMQRPCTNRILFADSDGKWIIVKFSDNITQEEFKKSVGIPFRQFMNALFYKFNNESDKWNTPKEYDSIQKHPLFKCMVQLVLDCDLQIGDIDKPNSWGKIDDKIVLRDYGLTRDIFDEYYADSSSNSSSSAKTSEE